MKSNHPVVLHALLIGIGAVLLYGVITSGQDWGDDFAAYITQAKSLTDGTTAEYVEANRFTINESSRIIGPVTYPWGMPLLLAPVYAWFGLNFFAMKLVIAFFYLLFLGLLSSGFRKMHGPFWLLCLIGLFAFNPAMLDTTNDIESDIPFLLISTATVLFIRKSIVMRERVVSPVGDALLLGTIIAIASFFRTTGVLLLATLFCTQAIVLLQPFWIARKGQGFSASIKTGIQLLRRIKARDIGLLSMPYVVYFVLMSAWHALFPYDGSAYIRLLEKLTPGTIKYHLEYYATLTVDFYKGAPFPLLIYLASLPLLVLGALRRYRTDYPMIAYAAISLILYIVWPDIQGLRFMYPLLPFYISFVLTGLETLSGAATSRRPALRKTLCALPVVLVALSFLVHSSATARTNLLNDRQSPNDAFTEATHDMFAFIETNTEPDSTIAFFKPRLMHMMTGRQSLLITTVPELPKADYFCLYTVRLYRQMPFEEVYQQAERGTIGLIYENNDFKIYRVTADRP